MNDATGAGAEAGRQRAVGATTALLALVFASLSLLAVVPFSVIGVVIIDADTGCTVDSDCFNAWDGDRPANRLHRCRDGKCPKLNFVRPLRTAVVGGACLALNLPIIGLAVVGERHNVRGDSNWRRSRRALVMAVLAGVLPGALIVGFYALLNAIFGGGGIIF